MTRHVNRAKDLLLYAGAGKETYNLLRPAIQEENRVLLRVFSRIGCIFFFLLYLVSVLYGGFASANGTAYFTCGIAMLSLMLCGRFLLRKRPSFVGSLVYLFEITLYVFSISVSLLHTDKPAVSAIAFLLVTPLLFYDRPARVCALIAADVAAFCVIVRDFKQPDVAETDVWNMVTFGAVAIAVTIFIMRIKIRSLSQSREIEYLSQTDVMTGAKNRNHYEKQLQKYPEMCASGLVCVYADANGLHELNYREGHEAGDRMLFAVADALRHSFGAEHTYRVGGDEFVAFQADGNLEDVLFQVDRMRQSLTEKGYCVSFGVAAQDRAKGALNMEELVKEAESRMFSDKRDFYRQPENNRRRR